MNSSSPPPPPPPLPLSHQSFYKATKLFTDGILALARNEEFRKI